MIRIGCILAFFAVVCGAFGAHGLEKILDDYSLSVWKTAVEYHFFHALALLALGLYEEQKKVVLNLVRWCFLTGILLFSGSLYALALSDLKVLGMITPLGGLAFLTGWLGFAYRAK